MNARTMSHNNGGSPMKVIVFGATGTTVIMIPPAGGDES